jgi:hypothetical protein
VGRGGGREREREREWAEEAFVPGHCRRGGVVVVVVVVVVGCCLLWLSSRGNLAMVAFSRSHGTLSLCRAASPCFYSLGAIRAMGWWDGR